MIDFSMQSSFQLLTTTLSAGFHPLLKQRLISMIRQASEDDWRDFLALTDHHNVSNLARSSFHKNELWVRLPDSVQQTLQSRYRNTVAWSLKLGHTLEQVVPAFESTGIPIIPWKGPLLSQRLFDNIWDREYIDLDFLVPPQSQSRTAILMRELGYDHADPDSIEPPASLANNNDHCQSWQHQSSRTMVELHWKPFPSAFRFTPTINDILSRCSTSPFRSVSLSQISVEDEFILLVGHGAKHQWSQLNWLCDFACFILRFGDSINWDYINDTARKIGFVRIIKTALILAEDFFTIAPPSRSFDHPVTDHIACQLADKYKAQLERSTPSLAQQGFRPIAKRMCVYRARQKSRRARREECGERAPQATNNAAKRNLCPPHPISASIASQTLNPGFQSIGAKTFGNGSSWKYQWFINSLLSREQFRDRLPVIYSALAYLFTPNRSDRELCPRSLPLSLCAWVVRPFRLIHKYALRPFKKNSTL
jgi:hypothetical protein